MNSKPKIIAFSVVIFAYFLFLNYCQPIAMDDYWRAINDTLVNHNLIAMLKQDYFGWTGRMSAQLLVYCLFSKKYITLSVAVVNILNALAYYLFILFSFKISTAGKYKLYSKAFCVYLFLFLLMFSLTGFIGQTLWKTAAIQYFWGICLVTILYYHIFTKNKQMVIAPVVIGIFIGLYNEQFVGVLLILCLTYFIDSILNRKKINRSVIYFALACFAGGVVLISAPGNYVRMDGMSGSHTHSIYQAIIKVIESVRYSVWPNTEVIFILFVAFIIFLFLKKHTEIKTKFIYSIALISIIFVMTPVIYSYGLLIRLMLIYYVIFFIATMHQFYISDNFYVKQVRSFLEKIYILFLIGVVYFAGTLAVNYYYLHEVSQEQDKIMMLADNKKLVVVPKYQVDPGLQNKYGITTRSLTCNPSDVNNQAFAKFYNVKQVIATPCDKKEN
ncbi:DUF6056 family protein [Francisella sp. SYW-9]|uniref:DUF6056 family protein n=1 Tax=Francisella sp. SYW-9 TaxID=2610888 RepID=UPI00123CB03C|nr:DUF6056 family protein [Francisella sp. SYW-9]